MMKILEEEVKGLGAEIVELNSVKDDIHLHFYKKIGYSQSSNFVSMGKYL